MLLKITFKMGVFFGKQEMGVFFGKQDNRMFFESELPEDMKSVIEKWENYSSFNKTTED
jgi:hypothetical protein